MKIKNNPPLFVKKIGGFILIQLTFSNLYDNILYGKGNIM